MSPEEPDGPALDITVLPVEAVVDVVSGFRRLELRCCSRVDSGVSVGAFLRLREDGAAAVWGAAAGMEAEFEVVMAESVCGVVLLSSAAFRLAVVERRTRWFGLGGISNDQRMWLLFVIVFCWECGSDL